MSQTERLESEFAFIAWLRERVAADPRVVIGIGDDTAALRLTPGRELLVTTDMILDGIHFDSTRTPARLIGRKAMGVNLSDVAAMAGVPVAAVVSIALPDRLGKSDAESIMEGIQELAGEFGVSLVGGDTNRSPSGIVICITIIGEATARGPVRRRGAKPGDAIAVTGSLGGSIHGKHLEFTPRVREALTLHEHFDLHAMIDVSDGLAADLGHILQESRCGAVLRAEAIPVSDAARDTVTDTSLLDRALYDGEDFELLCTLAAGECQTLVANSPLAVPIACIGSIISEPGLWLELPDKSRQPIISKGFDHFAHA